MFLASLAVKAIRDNKARRKTAGRRAGKMF
jgi:hypothetical protein